jgi:uncharacterized oligopeptide transporter (OPT) family protein
LKKPEITWQSIVGSIIISAILAFSYPYIVLKVGMGQSVSVLAAFMGMVWLGVFARKTRGNNACMNNIIQTAASSAAATAFMCVSMAAFGYLRLNPTSGFTKVFTFWEIFSWLSLSGTIGVLVASLFRKFFIEDKELTFVDGVAAAETIMVLDKGGESKGKLKFLSWGAGIGVLVSFLRDRLFLIPSLWFKQSLIVGLELNVLNIGIGMMLPLGIGISMLLGSFVVILFAPSIISFAGPAIIAQNPMAAGSDYKISMLWLMWPATALMITSALTAVLLQSKSIIRMFKNMKAAKGIGDESEVSPKTVLWFGGCLTVLLAYVQWNHFGVPFWQTIVAVVAGLPLILVGVRVLGLTNNGPVSLMANGIQAMFRLVSANIPHNLVAAGMAGDINSQGEQTMQTYKTGKFVGSTPRILTWVQFCAIPIGAAAVAYMYPLLDSTFHLGSAQMSSPTGLKLYSMAMLMSKGLSAFPPGVLGWTIAAAVIGVFMTLMTDVFKWRWVPNASAFGFALILPATLNLMIGIGAIIGFIWRKSHQSTFNEFNIPLASGFIGGEALMSGLLVPLSTLFWSFPA